MEKKWEIFGGGILLEIELNRTQIITDNEKKIRQRHRFFVRNRKRTFTS